MIRKKKILLKTKKLSDFFLRFPDDFSPYPTIKLLLTKNSFLRSLGGLFLAYDKLSSIFSLKILWHVIIILIYVYSRYYNPQ